MTLRVHPDEIVAESNSPLLACHDSWERVRLGDVVEIRNGAAFKSSFFNTDGDGLPLIRIRNVGKPESDTWYSGEYDDDYLVKPGDILIGMDGDFRVARWTGPTSLLNQRVCRLSVLSPEYLNKTFLLHLLQGYLDEVNKLTSSVTVKHLSSKTVQDLPIPLPPASEQQRIVDAVEGLFSHLDLTDQALESVEEKLVDLERSYVRQVFNEEQWPWIELGDIAELKGGVTKDAKRQSDPSFVEVPYLRVANVQRGYLDLSEVGTIRVDPQKADQLRLRAGDILFNEGGDRDKLGRGWVWEGQVEACIHQNHVFRARLQSDDFDPYFISVHGNTWGQEWFETNGKQTTNLASLNLTTLKRFPVPAPPRSEQRKVMTRLFDVNSTIDRLKSEVSNGLARSSALRRSVLAEAFAGRLVPQDPADEPASVLLDRIHAARETVKKDRGRVKA